MRVVTREQVEVGIRFVDQSGDVFEHVWRERHLLRKLLAGFASKRLQIRIDASVHVHDPIKSANQFGHPARTQLNSGAPKRGMTFENAIHNKCTYERLGHLVHGRGVFAADVFSATHPVLHSGPASVAPCLVELQRRPADMQQERST